MSQVITIGLVAEGTTDNRFIGSIIERTFSHIALNCDRDIDIYPIKNITGLKKDNFNDLILESSKVAYENGLNFLCVHCDADARNDSHVRQYKIDPSFDIVQQSEEIICKNLISIVPVHMSEAWMLADKEVFRNELNTNMSNRELNIEKRPEQYADPKEVICNAIRIAQEHLSRRRQKLNISDLYSPLGQKTRIDQLLELPSYEKFFNEVNAFLRCFDT